jgi:ribonuclease P protein component
VVTPQSNRFPRRLRVRKGEDFTAIIRDGFFAADAVLVVNLRRIPPGPDKLTGIAPDRVPPSLPTRFGVTIPKKHGCAVVRNQWKRWLREAFRSQRREWPAGLEIVARPRRGAEADYEKIRQSLRITIGAAIGKLRKRDAADRRQ